MPKQSNNIQYNFIVFINQLIYYVYNTMLAYKRLIKYASKKYETKFNLLYKFF